MTDAVRSDRPSLEMMRDLAQSVVDAALRARRELLHAGESVDDPMPRALDATAAAWAARVEALRRMILDGQGS